MREAMKNDYTQEEINNLESSKCWCGKPRAEFDKGMRVYCCKSHRIDWYDRTITWSAFRDQFLEEQGKKCAVCGCTPKSIKKNAEKSYAEWVKIVKNNKEAMKIVQEKRIQELEEIEDKYQKIMNDDYLIDFEFNRMYDLPKGIPKAPEKDHWIEDRFEVDHKLAVSLGGDMWDKENLQVLCTPHHKEKTKEDLKKLKAKRRGLKRFEEVTA